MFIDYGTSASLRLPAGYATYVSVGHDMTHRLQAERTLQPPVLLAEEGIWTGVVLM